jgi:acyl-CoA synthetase (AMP-forming)/AMP-acid ligase II
MSEGTRPAGTETSGTLAGRLAWQAAATPDRPFLVAEDGDGRLGVLTYDDVARRARAIAGLLNRLGVARGDRVHVQLGNVPEFLLCLFGAAHLGAVVVPTHPSATVDDVTYVMSHSRCRVSVTTVDHVHVVTAAAEMVPELAHVVSVDGPADGALDLATELAGASGEVPPAPVDSRDLAAVLYTSGTSGWPKGVMLTHENLLFAGEAVGQLVRLRPEDRWLVTLPLSHANALLYSVMSAFVTGASAALVARFEPARWAEQARAHGATVASVFAVHARELLAAGRQGAVEETGLRITLFAQHLTAQQRRDLEARYGSRLVQVYGLTETLAPTLADPVYGPRMPASVGRPTPWVDIRLVDPSGKDVPAGERGELLVRGVPGRSLMAGYLGRDEDTRRVLENGWFRTGDHMRVLPDGSYEFLGRGEDIMKPGVDNVSAAEIERVLLEHVSVVEAAVVSFWGPDRDETIAGFVVLRPDDDATADEVLAWARERLAAHKVPQQVVAVPALPRSAVGKVVKRDLHLPGGDPGLHAPPVSR